MRSVGIRGGTIAAIDAGPLRGKTVIDAAGHVVAPGFVDLHRHGQNDENYRYAALDGVTSVFELEVGTPDVDGVVPRTGTGPAGELRRRHRTHRRAHGGAGRYR